MVCLETASDFVQDTLYVVKEPADLIKRLLDAVQELGDTDSNSAKGNAIQQVDSSTEIGIPQFFHNTAGKTANSLYDSSANRLRTVIQSLKRLEELAVGQSGAHNTNRRTDTGAHISSRVKDLPHTFPSPAKKILEPLKSGDFEVFLDCLDELFYLGSSRGDKIRNTLAYPIKDVAFLRRLVNSDEPIPERGRHIKNAPAQSTKAVKQRAQSLEYCGEPLPNDVKNGE
ncbi:hypothetical protein AALA54_17290 [Oscillospiraceae bacterium 44-34]